MKNGACKPPNNVLQSTSLLTMHCMSTYQKLSSASSKFDKQIFHRVGNIIQLNHIYCQHPTQAAILKTLYFMSGLVVVNETTLT